MGGGDARRDPEQTPVKAGSATPRVGSIQQNAPCSPVRGGAVADAQNYAVCAEMVSE